jgi:hypothetical protein
MATAPPLPGYGGEGQLNKLAGSQRWLAKQVELIDWWVENLAALHCIIGQRSRGDGQWCKWSRG